MFSYRLQAQSVSLSALGCRPWQPIRKHSKTALRFYQAHSKLMQLILILLSLLFLQVECVCDIHTVATELSNLERTRVIKNASCGIQKICNSSTVQQARATDLCFQWAHSVDSLASPQSAQCSHLAKSTYIKFQNVREQ